MPKVIAFDVFGTVFDLNGVNRQDIINYINHIQRSEWSPLKLPESWENLKAHPDAVEGINRLREKFIVVTCSNCPLGLLSKISKHNNISWDAIIPLELNKVFKTNPKAYMTICEVMSVEPKDVLMVTANEKFGDIEASRLLGMQSILIRGNEGPKNIIELAELLIQ